MVRAYVGSSGSCICRDGTECMAAHTLGLNVFSLKIHFVIIV